MFHLSHQLFPAFGWCLHWTCSYKGSDVIVVMLTVAYRKYTVSRDGARVSGENTVFEDDVPDITILE